MQRGVLGEHSQVIELDEYNTIVPIFIVFFIDLGNEKRIHKTNLTILGFGRHNPSLIYRT